MLVQIVVCINGTSCSRNEHVLSLRMAVLSNADSNSASLLHRAVHEMVFCGLPMTLSNFKARGLSPQRRWEQAPCVRVCEADLFNWERVA